MKTSSHFYNDREVSSVFSTSLVSASSTTEMKVSSTTDDATVPEPVEGTAFNKT